MNPRGTGSGVGVCAGALVVAALGCGCGPSDSAPPVGGTYPEGTAVVVDGRPVAAAAIDALAQALEPLQPELTWNGQRRFALARLVLEREAVGSLLAEGRAEARRLAEAELELRRMGASPSVPSALVRGGTAVLGIASWCALAGASPDVWIGPVEEIGTTRLLRRLTDAEATLTYLRSPPPAPHEIAAEVLDFPWTDDLSRELVDRAVESARLEIPSPEWRDIVPIDLRHRMGAEAP
ncbi:MAG: hypothetical protein GC161_10790 [Planctomycetaceae bacterium]|nr:hypothetical protein [Planctomycetaceae bacterium]